MAALYPTSLDEYCTVFGISFFNLQLRCVFCKHWVSLQALADFFVKTLSLVWKNNICYACCSQCLRLIAKYESEHFTRCEVTGEVLQFIVKEPFSEIVIRCLQCYKKLDYAEKIDCCHAGIKFCLVRSHWRSLCRNCKPKQ